MAVQHNKDEDSDVELPIYQGEQIVHDRETLLYAERRALIDAIESVTRTMLREHCNLRTPTSTYVTVYDSHYRWEYGFPSLWCPADEGMRCAACGLLFLAYNVKSIHCRFFGANLQINYVK